MGTAAVTVEKRQDVGKGAVRRLREKGYIPGVIYGKGTNNINLSISEKELRKIALDSGQIVKVVVEGEGEHNVLIREYQKNPLTQRVIHLDLFEVSMTEKLTTVIPLVITGKAKGVSDGGVIQFDVREIEIECLPTDIVEGIEVDVSDLEIGDIIKVADLESPPGITILAEPEQIIVGVVAPHYEEEEEEEEEEEIEGEIEGEEAEETVKGTPEAETDTDTDTKA